MLPISYIFYTFVWIWHADILNFLNANKQCLKNQPMQSAGFKSQPKYLTIQFKYHTFKVPKCDYPTLNPLPPLSILPWSWLSPGFLAEANYSWSRLFPQCVSPHLSADSSPQFWFPLSRYFSDFSQKPTLSSLSLTINSLSLSLSHHSFSLSLHLSRLLFSSCCRLSRLLCSLCPRVHQGLSMLTNNPCLWWIQLQRLRYYSF